MCFYVSAFSTVMILLLALRRREREKASFGIIAYVRAKQFMSVLCIIATSFLLAWCDSPTIH
jgi:hypothetical protein